MELTSPVKPNLREYAELALQLCLSALIFAILMLPIVGLDALSDYLVRVDVKSKFVLYALNSVEYMLFLVNTIAFFASIVALTVRMLRRTWKGDIQGSSQKFVEARHRWEAIALGATATVAVLVSVVYLVAPYINAGSESITYETAANESRTEKLSDGTRMTLGAQSKVQVGFTAELRGVQHLGGEAKFDVAPDAAMRPFVVSTFLVDVIGGGGAKFGVVVDTTVTVTAHEGTVRVSGRGAKPSSPGFTVQPGESYRVPVDGFRTVVAGDGTNVARVHPLSS